MSQKNFQKEIKKSEKFGWLDLIKSFLFLADEKRVKYIVLVFVLLGLLFYDIVPPLILGKIVDFFTGYKNGNTLSPFFILVAIYGVSFGIVSFLRLSTKKSLNKMKTDIVYFIRVKGFQNLLNQSLLEHSEENTGSKAQKIENGTTAFNRLFHLSLNSIFPAIASFIGIIFIYLFLGKIYILLFGGYVFIFFTILKYFYRKVSALNFERNKAMENASGSYIEGLNNILTIKATGSEKTFQGHIENKETIKNKFAHAIIDTVNRQWSVFQFFNGIYLALFLLVIGRGVVLGSITVGAIVIFFSYFQKLQSTSANILELYGDLIESKTGMGRMMPLFFKNKNHFLGTKNFPNNWKKIILKNVNFQYRKSAKESEYKGVKDISLEILKGQKIGLAGKTGCGKSTLAKLLIGLFPIDKGSYSVDKISFYDIKDDDIQKNISIVLQDSEMFNMTLKDNITLMREFNPILFEKAIRISQLMEVIKKLPQGVDTLIGEKGYYLSGGERQRLDIARAIYKDSSIIIFDEATSALDNKTEQLIQNALETQLSNKTLIFIAHRITTLQQVDCIYVFKDGRVVEKGNYTKLMANKNSEFYELNKKKKIDNIKK